MRVAVLMLPLVMGACVAPLADTYARDVAKSAVNPIVASRFPGVPLEPATNCVIDNASAGEIFTLAQAAGSGANDAAARLVLDIASRPATIQCLATDGLPVLLTTF